MMTTLRLSKLERSLGSMCLTKKISSSNNKKTKKLFRR
jgi:hypothetical protein